jgi:hypothetical protein
MCFRNYFCSLKNFISCADTISFLNGCKSSYYRYDYNGNDAPSPYVAPIGIKFGKGKVYTLCITEFRACPFPIRNPFRDQGVRIPMGRIR